MYSSTEKHSREKNDIFKIDITTWRKLLWDKYKDLSDEEIGNIINVTINFWNLIINSYLDTIWKTQ